MKITLVDTQTGAIATDEQDTIPEYYISGNGSCDCNREQPFGNETPGNFCIGEHRYIIVDATDIPDGEPLFELEYWNDCYDMEVIEKAIKIYQRRTK